MSDQAHIVCPYCDTVNRLPRERLAEQPACGKCAQALFTGAPVEVDSARFEKHITRNDIPVLVDFWAAWCGPCRMMAPAFQQAAAQLEPHVRLLKVDTEASQDLAMRFGIRSIPLLAMFHHGGELARQAGAVDAGRIVAWAQQTARQVR